jgi:ribosome-associated toxin RatA of RatAB toxin-antitoxin module
MVTVERSALVNYSAQILYALVADVDSYPQFLPWCSAAEADTSLPDVTVATLHVSYHGIRQQFTTRNVNQPEHQIEISLVSGPFRHLKGTWRFEALAPQASKVSLHLEYQLSNALLERVVGPVFNHIANTFVDAFVRRAEALYGEK